MGIVVAAIVATTILTACTPAQLVKQTHGILQVEGGPPRPLDGGDAQKSRPKFLGRGLQFGDHRSTVDTWHESLTKKSTMQALVIGSMTTVQTKLSSLKTNGLKCYKTRSLVTSASLDVIGYPALTIGLGVACLAKAKQKTTITTFSTNNIQTR